MDERNRLGGWGKGGLERKALSLGGALTVAFGLAVLSGGIWSIPVLRDVHSAWPTVSPALALWLVFAGGVLAALGSGPDAVAELARRLRIRAPRQALVVSAAALATSLAATVAVAHGRAERDRQHAAVAELAEHEVRTTVGGPVDRLTDVASTVRGPLSVRRSQFAGLAERLLNTPAITSVALARSVPGTEPAHGAPSEEPGRPGRWSVVFASARDSAAPSFHAVAEHAGRSALESATRSGQTRATRPLARADGGSADVAIVVPVRPARKGSVAGAFVASFSVTAVRDAVAEGLPEGVRFTFAEGERRRGDLNRPLVRPVVLGDRLWSIAVERPPGSYGLALATLLVGGLLTILVGVLSAQSARREPYALRLLDARDAERASAERARRAAEERSRVLAETSTDLICVLAPSGALKYASPACRDLLGREPEQLLGARFVDLVHPDDAAGVEAVFAEPRNGDVPLTVTHRMRRGDGAVWVETRLRLVRDPVTNAIVEGHATVRDVGERMQSQAVLAEAEERFRSAFEEAPIGMALTSPDFRFLRVNRALCRITGYTREQLEGLPVASITHPDDLKGDWEARGAMLEGELTTYRGERRYLHASGSPVWVLINSTLVRDGEGRPLHFLSQMQDITERHRHEAELRHMADHDPLTGLLNRRSFEGELERHVAYVERYGPKGAAIVLDLDHFKTVNDTLGHSAGDELIVRVAHALRSRLRESDVLARLGGDEFAILLPEASPEEAEAVAGAVLEAVRTQTVPTATGRTRTVTASLGLALFEADHALTGEEVLVNADLAMYDAKEAGRDQMTTYSSAEHVEQRLQARMSWADMIRDALAEDRFVLHAQPIVDLNSGAITQYELLLRMCGGEGELIGPAAFLPVAERFDLMPSIDRWVVTNAIRMVREERRRGRELVVEVNISGASAGDPELLALIERELSSADVDPGQIIFEITETIAVGNIPRAQHFAARLADLGCRFALDDFGAGFGSFYYLKHLPFDYLKIDGEFVRHSALDSTDQLVIQAVVDIARGLGKRTIAEHVGDAETAALLRRMGVDHAQGFHLGAPAPLDEWLPEPLAVAS